ncbi:MAG TPA: glycosyltransferase family 39 protein [Acidobacteriaceae bacterium]|nr:glycosyltransferase family 39 protein [Acidobacteriaceae bacterium]
MKPTLQPVPGKPVSGHLHVDLSGAPTLPLDAWFERGFLAFLGLVFAYLAWFSSHKLLWFDELLCYYTQRSATTAAVLRIQASTPISLDPPFYHLLGHWMLQLGLNQAFAIRFPALLGCAAMTLGVYLYTRRIAGFYPAAISVAGLLLTYDFYLVEARPYGILLGATGLSLLLWQNCIRNIHRRSSLIALALVLGLAVSCHYFGILVAVPLLLAEFFRTLRQRKLDIALLAALFAGYLPVLSWLPFMKAAAQYKAHYYVSAAFMNCIRTYSWLDEIHRNNRKLWPGADLLLFLAIVASVVAGAWLSYRASRKLAPNHPGQTAAPSSLPEEWAALVFLALVPVAGGILALAGAGSYLARYVLESSIGLMVPRIGGILTFVPSRILRRSLLILCCVLIVAAFLRDQRKNAKAADLMRFSEAQAQSGKLVIPDQYDDFLRLHYYFDSNPLQTRQFPFIADMARELTWKGTDNLSRTMINIQQFTTLPVMSYEQLLHTRQPIVVIVDKSNRHTWIVDQLEKDNAQLSLIATRGNLSVYDVRLPAGVQP